MQCVVSSATLPVSVCLYCFKESVVCSHMACSGNMFFLMGLFMSGESSTQQQQQLVMNQTGISTRDDIS